MERVEFSSQISTFGPYPISGNENFRPMNFVALASTGLMSYLKNAQVTRPAMKISDELKDQYSSCRNIGKTGLMTNYRGGPYFVKSEAEIVQNKGRLYKISVHKIRGAFIK